MKGAAFEKLTLTPQVWVPVALGMRSSGSVTVPPLRIELGADPRERMSRDDNDTPVTVAVAEPLLRRLRESCVR